MGTDTCKEEKIYQKSNRYRDIHVYKVVHNFKIKITDTWTGKKKKTSDTAIDIQDVPTNPTTPYLTKSKNCSRVRVLKLTLQNFQFLELVSGAILGL